MKAEYGFSCIKVCGIVQAAREWQHGTAACWLGNSEEPELLGEEGISRKPLLAQVQTPPVCREVQGDANSTCVMMAAEQIASSVRVRHRPVEAEKVATQRSSQPGSAKQRGGLAGVEQRLRVEPHKHDGRGRSQRDIDLRGDQAK